MNSLHQQLLDDCHYLGVTGTGALLLHRDAGVPWLILVPATEAGELHDLDSAHYHQVLSEVRRLARFIKQHYGSERINIAAIGNVVPQLHIHIVGRHSQDPCWPRPVWGNLQSDLKYSDQQLHELTTLLDKQRLLRQEMSA